MSQSWLVRQADSLTRVSKVAHITGSWPTMAASRPPTLSKALRASGTCATEPLSKRPGQLTAQRLRAVRLKHLGVVNAGVLQVAAGEVGQARLYLQRQHLLRAVGQQSRHKARAGADFKHFFVSLNIQVLQQPGFHLGAEHALAGVRVPRQRNFQVGKGQQLVGSGDKIFTLDLCQERQYLAVQHLPGADLLLNHVKACLFNVHLGHVLEKASLQESE